MAVDPPSPTGVPSYGRPSSGPMSPPGASRAPAFYPQQMPQSSYIHPSRKLQQTAYPQQVGPTIVGEGFGGGEFGGFKHLRIPTESREKVVEVPEVQVVEKIVEVVQRVRQERLVHVPKIETVEKTVAVPKPVYKERIVEVPQVQYRDVPFEKIVEVPEVQTQVVVREVIVPVQVEVPIVEPRKANIEQQIVRNIPMPVELRVSEKYEIPKLKPRYKEVPVPIYVPRYIEVPVPAQFASAMQSNSPTASACYPRLTSQQQFRLCSQDKLPSPQMRTFSGLSPIQQISGSRQVSPIGIPTGSGTPAKRMSRQTSVQPLAVS